MFARVTRNGAYATIVAECCSKHEAPLSSWNHTRFEGSDFSSCPPQAIAFALAVFAFSGSSKREDVRQSSNSFLSRMITDMPVIDRIHIYG